MNAWDTVITPILSRPDVAGMLGSMVGSFSGGLPDTAKAQRVLNMAGGMVIAYYTGPIVADTLGIANPRAQTGIGFLAGMLGLATLTQISAALRAVDWKPRIDAVLDRVFGAKKP